MEKQNKARFDARLSMEQKQFFERAAVLGGFRSLTDFVLETVQDKAKEIIEESEQFLSTEQDKRVFFDAIMNPPMPNSELIDAKESYEKLIDE